MIPVQETPPAGAARKGMKCPACGRCTSRPAGQDPRIRRCGACDALWLLPAAHPAFPAGIRKGKRCVACGRCTVAVAVVEWSGIPLILSTCRNPQCGSVSLARGESATRRPRARAEFVPVEVAGGLSDLLAQVRE